jgi:hypothetical protein
MHAIDKCENHAMHPGLIADHRANEEVQGFRELQTPPPTFK